MDNLESENSDLAFREVSATTEGSPSPQRAVSPLPITPTPSPSMVLPRFGSFTNSTPSASPQRFSTTAGHFAIQPPQLIAMFRDCCAIRWEPPFVNGKPSTDPAS